MKKYWMGVNELIVIIKNSSPTEKISNTQVQGLFEALGDLDLENGKIKYNGIRKEIVDGILKENQRKKEKK